MYENMQLALSVFLDRAIQPSKMKRHTAKHRFRVGQIPQKITGNDAAK
jgi:hypothetical protein